MLPLGRKWAQMHEWENNGDECGPACHSGMAKARKRASLPELRHFGVKRYSVKRVLFCIEQIVFREIV